MGAKEDLVLIDTNVFVIDLRYKRDENYKINSYFLDYISQKKTGFTTIINLLELCGILSFNLNEKQLRDLWVYFQDRYRVTVLPSPDMDSSFPNVLINEIFDIIKNRASLGDALIIAAAHKHLSFVSTMITWDKIHFKDKFSGAVLTPAEFLQ